MRRAVPAALSILIASPAAAQRDMNCSDFRTRRQVQAFFEPAGPGDPHGLDRDGDGIACESLPRG
jgi:hypothetical protein